MSSRSKGVAGALALVTAVLGGCADVERGPRPPAPDAAPDVGPAEAGARETSAPSFAMVRPLIESGCRRCHASGQMAGDSSFLLNGDAMAEYTAVRVLVDPAAPASSRLLVKGAGQGHSGGVIYGPKSPEYAALLAWIAGGAAP